MTRLKSPRRMLGIYWIVRASIAIAVVGAIALGVMLYGRGVLFAQGHAELAEALAETDEDDPDWKWEAIVAGRPVIPDDENSARVIHEAAELLTQPRAFRTPEGNAKELLDGGPPNRLLDETRLAAVREALEQNDSAVQRAATLSRFSRGRIDVVLTPDVLSSLMPLHQRCGSVLRILEFDSERILHSDRPRTAIDRIQAMLAISGAVRDDPFAIAQLVRTATRMAIVRNIERSVALQEIPDADCARLMTDLLTEASENLLLPAIRGERAQRHFLFGNLESGRVPLAALSSPNPADYAGPNLRDRFNSWCYACRLADDHAQSLRLLNDAVRIARLPIEERGPEWADFDVTMRAAKAQAEKEGRWLVSVFMMSNLPSVHRATVRDMACLRCAIAALAAERFRLARQRWPTSLDELCPDFLAAALVDPSNGEPLSFDRRDDGLTIRAAGIETRNAAVPSLRRGDPVFRLWNPDQRRLPPVKADDE